MLLNLAESRIRIEQLL